MQAEAIKIIKEELEKRGLKVIKIILFGSRSRGDYDKGSDWDFLVVVDKEIQPRERREILGEIRIKLVYSNIPSDIIVVSEKQLNERKNDVGHITYYAVKEGVEL